MRICLEHRDYSRNQARTAEQLMAAGLAVTAAADKAELQHYERIKRAVERIGSWLCPLGDYVSEAF